MRLSLHVDQDYLSVLAGSHKLGRGEVRGMFAEERLIVSFSIGERSGLS